MPAETFPKVLAQLRPADTNAASLYSPPDNTVTEITKLVICNTTNGGLAFRVFLDDDGTTYDQTTALYYDEALAANTTVEIGIGWGMRNPAGNLAVRSSANDGLTFTLFGKE